MRKKGFREFALALLLLLLPQLCGCASLTGQRREVEQLRIKYLSKNKVDLILLDHEMPVTSGPQVLEMLRSEEETKHIPVMFLTGKGDKESVMAVVALRPEGYFLKTIQREELLEKLQAFFVLHK